MRVGSLLEWELASSNHPYPEPFFWYFNSQNPLLGRLQVEKPGLKFRDWTICLIQFLLH